MTDLDTTLRRDLAALADEMPVTDITEESVRRGHQLRMRRTTIAATTGVAIVVAAVVVPLTLAGRSADRGVAGSIAHPHDDDALKHLLGVKSGPHIARSFEVAAPYVVGPYTGGPVSALRRCGRSQITAAAQTRPTADGVVGVAVLSGKNCDPDVTGIRGLFNGNQPLAVPVQQSLGTHVVEPSLATSALGFAWRGSWCGPDATVVVVTYGGRTRDGTSQHPEPVLDVPVSGPSPSCSQTSGSVLDAGRIGEVGTPLQAPPPSWFGLREQLHLTDPHTSAAGVGLTVTLRNPTSKPIALSPCPAIAMSLTVLSHGISIDGFGPQSLGCPATPRVVPANGSLTIPIPDSELARQAGGHPATVKFGIGATITVLRTRVR